ncbi:MAG: DnaJ domain-containing protein [Candidatus Altarchaeum sp.]|nr:DnaJ domain-containing protein [Candidatus Altarchaeum sp.]
MLYHPDRASADIKKINEEKFKGIAETYAVLSNDEKKAQYDEFERIKKKRINAERGRRAWDERINAERENRRTTGQNRVYREYIYKTSSGHGNFFHHLILCRPYCFKQ